MKKNAILSTDRVYRYSLSRIWDESKSYLNVIGLNPSTADEMEDDRTSRRCIGFAKDWGYGGLIMTNLFAFRTTKPADMRAADEPIGPENNKHLILIAEKSGMVLAAWGTHGNFNNRDKEVINILLPEKINCLKITKSGLPAHPLYIKADTKPLPLL